MMTEIPHDDHILSILTDGDLDVTGQFVYGSNFTFLVDVHCQGEQLAAVYKPSRGERPLWDFPIGTLAPREAAAYLTSRALGWSLVPPTIVRDDGPAGPGSLQLFVDADPEHHYFTFTPAQKQALRPAAAFDALINNADRKGGHVLMGNDGHIWLIDHGVCFHTDDKLRTVIWDFAGEPIPEPILDDLAAFLAALQGRELEDSYRELLDPDEIKSLQQRAADLLRQQVFPTPGPGRPYPWPLV